MSRSLAWRWVFGCALMGALVTPAAAQAQLPCEDMCSGGTTQGCALYGVGCHPDLLVCAPCADDTFCRPHGTCIPGGVCVDFDCTRDAGVPDTGTEDGGEDGGDGDAAARDATSGGVGQETNRGDGPGGGPPGRSPDKGMYQEPCTCRGGGPGAPGATALLLLIFGVGLGARRRRAT